MIIEHIAVLNEAARPSPDYMHVLRLVAVESVARNINELEHNHERKEAGSRHELRRSEHAKVVGAALCKRSAPRRCRLACRYCRFQRHLDLIPSETNRAQ